MKWDWRHFQRSDGSNVHAFSDLMGLGFAIGAENSCPFLKFERGKDLRFETF